MTTAPTKKLIAIQVTNGGATDYATIVNNTQKWKKRVKLNSSGECLYNPSVDSKTVATSDSISVYINGRIVGNGSGTMTSGGVEISITAAVDTKSRMVIL